MLAVQFSSLLLRLLQLRGSQFHAPEVAVDSGNHVKNPSLQPRLIDQFQIQTPGGTTLTTIEDAEEGPAFGAGLSYDLTENVYLKGDYTYYSFEDTDTNGVMLGVGYKF